MKGLFETYWRNRVTEQLSLAGEERFRE